MVKQTKVQLRVEARQQELRFPGIN